MVIAQSSRLAKWLDVVIKQGQEILIPNVLNASGDLLHPSLQSSIIHLKEMIPHVVSNIRRIDNNVLASGKDDHDIHSKWEFRQGADQKTI